MRFPEHDKDNGNNMNWDNIKTIAQFDGDVSEIDDLQLSSQPGQGDGTTSTCYVEERNIGELAAGKPSTSISLLIESLVQLLCLVLENDSSIAHESYKAICEQLHKINLIDDSYSLNEFDEIRSQYQMQVYKIICAVRGQDIPITLPNVENKPQSVETCWSRYRREFDEISFIAGGGFGKVFKARHKLDCIEYAVKQIKIHSTTIKLCHLAEVKTIASLNHQNIVQYKAAWLEPYLVENDTTPKIKNTDDYTEDEEEYDDYTDSQGQSQSESTKYWDKNYKSNNESSDFIQFEHSKTNEDNNSNEQLVLKQVSDLPQALCKYESQSVQTSKARSKLAILYIQMSLCQLTLRKWLDDRNACNSFEEFYGIFFQNRDPDVTHLDIVHDVFCQILSGLNYIHSRNIVHHDIKPSNIFLIENDGRLIAQLGDFGLACPLQNGHHGIALGTPMYAAPEQLEGKCNPKSDIFSLGIVLLELLLKFKTDMERVRTIEGARKGILPPDLSMQSSNLLHNLLNHENSRPNTKDLLEAVRAINLEQNLRALRVSQVDVRLKDIRIKQLKCEIKKLNDGTNHNDHQIQKLLYDLDVKDKIINDLQERISEQDILILKLKAAISSSDSIKQ